jgi:hypothetical protein
MMLQDDRKMVTGWKSRGNDQPITTHVSISQTVHHLGNNLSEQPTTKQDTNLTFGLGHCT